MWPTARSCADFHYLTPTPRSQLCPARLHKRLPPRPWLVYLSLLTRCDRLCSCRRRRQLCARYLRESCETSRSRQFTLGKCRPEWPESTTGWLQNTRTTVIPPPQTNGLQPSHQQLRPSRIQSRRSPRSSATSTTRSCAAASNTTTRPTSTPAAPSAANTTPPPPPNRRISPSPAAAGCTTAALSATWHIKCLTCGATPSIAVPHAAHACSSGKPSLR